MAEPEQDLLVLDIRGGARALGVVVLRTQPRVRIEVVVDSREGGETLTVDGTVHHFPRAPKRSS